MLKSVKRVNTGLVPGARTELLLRADSASERDEWVEAMRQETIHPLARAASRRKFLLRTKSASGTFRLSPRTSRRWVGD